MLVAEGIVSSISQATVRRILFSHDLRPWRVHSWLSPQVPRDADFCARIRDICELYTRVLPGDEAVLCVDEKTSLQPRPRTAATQAAAPGQPIRVEHGYARGGALHLLAAFDTRTGKVSHQTVARKDAAAFIAFLDYLNQELPPLLTTVHIVLDNLQVHKSKAVMAWLTEHPRFRFHFPPVHCSWLNQVEQWFSILQRKLLRFPNFANLTALEQALAAFISYWNRSAHPFNWTTGSVCKVMARYQYTPDYNWSTQF